jgi:hypothetical protein
MAGTGVFGWCLPSMPAEQHANCKQTFEYGTTLTCTCPCHTEAGLPQHKQKTTRKKGKP